MIGQLSGTVIERAPPLLVIECAGVGYEVWAPMPAFEALPQVGSPGKLFIHPVIREDSHTLYGFATQEDRQFFRAMIRVSGVGAKSALAILSAAPAARVAAAIQEGDPALLARAPGIGKKTAERIVNELKGMALPAGAEAGAPAVGGQGDVEKALLSLGFSQKEVRAAVAKLPAESASEDIEERIRLCLRMLS